MVQKKALRSRCFILPIFGKTGQWQDSSVIRSNNIEVATFT